MKKRILRESSFWRTDLTVDHTPSQSLTQKVDCILKDSVWLTRPSLCIQFKISPQWHSPQQRRWAAAWTEEQFLPLPRRSSPFMVGAKFPTSKFLISINLQHLSFCLEPLNCFGQFCLLWCKQLDMLLNFLHCIGLFENVSFVGLRCILKHLCLLCKLFHHLLQPPLALH